MADLRLPYAIAQSTGLLPDFAQISADFECAADALREEFIEGSPRLELHSFPFPHAVYELWEALINKNLLLIRPFGYDLTRAQRAIEAAYFLSNACPPWEYLTCVFDTTLGTAQQSLILWGAHEIDLGRTTQYLDAYARAYLLDPDAMRAVYAADPVTTWRDNKEWNYSDFEAFRIRKNLGLDGHNKPWVVMENSAPYLWWSSPDGQLDFHRRVLDYAQRHLNELIAIDEQ